MTKAVNGRDGRLFAYEIDLSARTSDNGSAVVPFTVRAAGEKPVNASIVYFDKGVTLAYNGATSVLAEEVRIATAVIFDGVDELPWAITLLPSGDWEIIYKGGSRMSISDFTTPEPCVLIPNPVRLVPAKRGQVKV